MVGNEMTALETLQKYGLKTDVKSIRERLYNPDNYFLELKITFSNTIDGTIKAINAEDIVHDADLALLCELAEKGERWERAVTIIKNRRNKLRGESANGFQSKLNEFTVDTLDYLLMKITEAEGEGK